MNPEKEDQTTRWFLVETAAVCGFVLILVLSSPLRSALMFGGDEGFELMKAFLVSKGFPLYSKIWSDQPALHTEFLALLFRFFGPSAAIARIVTVCFSALLAFSLYKCVGLRTSRMAGLIASLLLISSENFWIFSVSVMSELPSMALGMAALWMLMEFSAQGRFRWLVLSALLLGCALHVKLTAALLVPAMLSVLITANGGRSGEERHPAEWLYSRRQRFRQMVAWCFLATVIFGMISVITFREGALGQIWKAHFGSYVSPVFESVNYQFHTDYFLRQFALVVSAATGIVFAAFRARRDLVVPIVLLLTAIIVDTWHHPFFYWYYLHFVIPLAWLGGAGIFQWSRWFWCDLREARAPNFLLRGAWIVWALGIAYVGTFVVLGLNHERAQVQFVKIMKPEPDEVVALKRWAADSKWVLTDQVIYAFWAGLPVPPELAVISRKRMASAQINAPAVIKCLDRYRPEQILADREFIETFQLGDYIKANYRQGNIDGHFIRKDLAGGNMAGR